VDKNRMKQKQPLITIIVAVLNGAETLQRCVDSVVGQTYPHKELIIIDGDSTDGTVEILRDNSGNLAYWESKPDRGIYHAWNRALDHAHGEWIYFLGADDYLWSPDVLVEMIPYLTNALPQIRIVYGSVAMVSAKGDVLEVHGKPWKQVKRHFFQGKCIPHQGVFHHHSLFQLHGGFDSSFKVAGDYEFLLRELKRSDAHFVDDVVVAGQQIGGLCNDPSYELLTLREYIIAQKRHLGDRPFLQFWWFYLKANAKRALRYTIGARNTNYIVDFYRVINGRPVIWSRHNNQNK
jgi:glycosyltransferase involved in cell wall biosynthesis